MGAKILEGMSKKLGINIYEDFDLIVGTSTGSIIAAALAAKYDISQLVSNYKSEAPRIFHKKWYRDSLWCSKYPSQYIECFLRKQLGEAQLLGNIEKPLIINATNITTSSVHLFKSRYQQYQRSGADYTRDPDIPLYQAVLASCAAPGYFAPVRINNDLLCDGGLWANNPALVGYIDAIRNFQQASENIRILSIGTGMTVTDLPKRSKQPISWGIATGWWRRIKLVDLAMNCATQMPQNCLDLIMKGNIMRINPSIGQCELDDTKTISTLQAIADKEITDQGTKIKNFLQKS